GTTSHGDDLVVQTGQGDWHATTLKHARRQIRAQGAALLPLIWSHTQLEHDQPITMAALTEFLQQCTGFAWLDEEQAHWFWLGPDGANRPAALVREMLLHAGRAVDIEDVYA